MSRILFYLACSFLLGACSPLVLACTAPAKAGAVICFPSSQATVTFPMTIEGAATGENGLPMTKMILYSNNLKIFEQDNADPILMVDEGDYLNQSYHLVLNAWDAGGNLFQASTEVTQINGTYSCTYPVSGIHLCSPPNGTSQPQNNLQILAYASSDVTSMNLWLNGKLMLITSGNTISYQYQFSPASVAVQTLDIRAYKGNQEIYTAQTNYLLYYPSLGTTCSTCPAIEFENIANYEDVNSPFTVQAQAVQNTEPIATMKIYLDDNVVGTSTGATMVATVNAAAGTHLLTVQAWDTTGALYKTQQTVNVY